MKKNDIVRLSKLMSVALRHDPAAFQLTLDENGWVPLTDLIEGITKRQKWAWIGETEVQHIVETSDKQRFEVEGELIRARYGHSQAARPNYPPVIPPEILYHGTPRRALEAIRRDGLKSMSRQYVHLAAEPDMAVKVGQRRDDQPVVLQIRAKAAYEAGVVFGTPSGGEDNVYLVDVLPSKFIEFP